MPLVRYPSRELLQAGRSRSLLLVLLLGLAPEKAPRQPPTRRRSSPPRVVSMPRDASRDGLALPRRFLLALMRWGARGIAAGRQALRLLRPALRQLPHEPGDTRGWVEWLEAENASLHQGRAELRQRVADLELRLLEAQEEAERARADVAYWKEEFFEFQKTRARPSSLQLVPESPPIRVAEALSRVEQAHPERIAIKLNSVSDRASPFHDAEAVYKALVFLATTYVDARSNRHPCPDLDAACREASGFLYKPRQSPVTMGRYRHDYETTWQGEKVALEEHLAKGTIRDPRYAIRIGFFFDRKQNRVVVGYIGQHQTTADT